ncbi:MAG TPA: glycerol kinase GlpK [Nocardioidaceae bacterium]|nr:glycerol kinase GlpK [Nocardioidaceae bacterium]
MTILAIDAGTTGVTALVVDQDGTIVAKGYQEFPQHFPRPGWVEHAPEEIWQATLEATRAALHGGHEPTALGITNQRETVLLWDRETLSSPRRALVWQDRRTADICTRLRDAGHEPRVAALTGLRLDPYFSGTKLTWLAEHEPHTWALVESGRYAVGTVDSYLIARMTRGTWHVTDVSNASRTLLFDLEGGDWSDELCELFGVPRAALPEVVPSWGKIATTDPTAFLGLELPIAGIAGDQQAALFGQTCYDVGDSKATYGTGSFVLTNTGTEVVRSEAGLLSTAAWRSPDGATTYACEGAIFVTGAAVQWLRDGLQLLGSAAESEAIAATVPDSGDVVFVPALTGLGAPDWDPHARGLIIGLTRGTTRAHLVRATLEAIAFEVRDVIDTLAGQTELTTLAVDGGAAANDLLCQLQADQLGVPVERPKNVETTGLGAAFLAGLGTGVWSSTDELRATWALDRRFEPRADRATADAAHARWRQAVERAKSWA